MTTKIKSITGYIILLIFSLLFLNNGITAQELPEKPNPPKLVNDYTSTLSETEKNLLENKLVSYSDSTSTQITIVITNDLLGYDKSDYAIRLAEKWGIGQKGKNNGVLILVKPKGKQGERGVFIAVGYGLESVITDAISRRIIENEMIPNFKQNKFYDGLNQATDILMKLASGEFPPEYKNIEETPPAIAFLIPIIVIILVLFLMKMGRNSKTLGRNPSFWTTLFLLSTMNNRGHGGSWGGFSSGSRGFGGFGGGSFGGGGAGGSW